MHLFFKLIIDFFFEVSVKDVNISMNRIVVQNSIAEKYNVLLCGSMFKIIMRILIQISSWPFDWIVSNFMNSHKV